MVIIIIILSLSLYIYIYIYIYTHNQHSNNIDDSNNKTHGRRVRRLACGSGKKVAAGLRPVHTSPESEYTYA